MTASEALSDDHLSAYLRRIGMTTRPAADVAGLFNVQQAHRRSIAFENIDVLIHCRRGEPLSLRPDDVFAKLVLRKRGGYCFEHNSLYLRALLALGFSARPLMGRVWYGNPTTTPPRTHTLNLVQIDGEDWITDTGFGGGDVPPMALREHELTTADGTRFGLSRHDDFGWMVSRNGLDQFSFTLDRIWPDDLAQGNHWTSAAPDSKFLHNYVVSIIKPAGFVAFTCPIIPDVTADPVAQQRLADDLSRRFGIALAPSEIALLPAHA